MCYCGAIVATAGSKCDTDTFYGQITPKCGNTDGICVTTGMSCTVQRECICGNDSACKDDICIVSNEPNYNTPC